MSLEEKAKEFSKISIKDKYQLENMCRECGFTIYIEYDENYIDMEKLDKKYSFLKKLHYNGIQHFSYSIKEINKYFGREVLEEGCITQSFFTINYLIYLYNKEKYWDEFV
jgi:hypothetical protein